MALSPTDYFGRETSRACDELRCGECDGSARIMEHDGIATYRCSHRCHQADLLARAHRLSVMDATKALHDARFRWGEIAMREAFVAVFGPPVSAETTPENGDR